MDRLPAGVQRELTRGTTGLEEPLKRLALLLLDYKEENKGEIRKSRNLLEPCVTFNVQGINEFAPRTLDWIDKKWNELRIGKAD